MCGGNTYFQKIVKNFSKTLDKCKMKVYIKGNH